MVKPILLITIKNAPMARLQETHLSLPQALKDEYHVLVMTGDETGVRVFFEKDHVELNQDDLKRLLSIHDKK